MDRLKPCRENCAECKNHSVFWGTSGCNLLNNNEHCKYEPRDGRLTMERLTERIAGITGLKACYEGCDHLDNGCDCVRIRGALIKLSRYEDTGLTPERCAELAAADRDGRVVVLPCKVGDTVYRTFFVPGRDPVIVEVKMNNRLDIIGFSPRFGKTVFLTHAEAEAALKGGADDV